MGTTLSLGLVDLTGLQLDFAANKGMIRVIVCAVVAAPVKNAAVVRTPGDDEVKLVPVAGLGCLKDTLHSSLHLK